MATEKWSAATARANQLTTELNALADGSYSAAGTALDNATNRDRFGLAELTATFASAPTADAPLHLYAVVAPDGTNYCDGGGSVRPPDAVYLGTFQARAVTTAQRMVTRRFELPPTLMKFVLYNGCGQAFPATGSVVNLYTFNKTAS
jgi:hypothetical protein